MALFPHSRRRIVRTLAVTAATAAGLTVAVAAPASAANGQRYDTMAECRSAQVAFGSSSFVRISRACYGFVPQIAPGVWDPNYVVYRFEYVTRTN